jgi:hypothetical protein
MVEEVLIRLTMIIDRKLLTWLLEAVNREREDIS